MVRFLLRVYFVLFISGYLNAQSNEYSGISFLKNEGQWHSSILYSSSTNDEQVRLLNNGISFARVIKDNQVPLDRKLQVWNLEFRNTYSVGKLKSGSTRQSKVSYFIGSNPADWVIHPDVCDEVFYEEVYKGIDVRLYGKDGMLEYDYIISPGSDPGNIVNGFNGIDGLRILEDGSLEIKSGRVVQKLLAPEAFQIIENRKVIVPCRYKLLEQFGFAFELGNYDKSAELIIDPLFQMVWSSYTQIPGGSNNINYCFSNAMDLHGNVYMTGMVDNSFPITPGAYSGPNTVQPEVFVAKFSGDGTSLIYWTYLPGNSSEFGVSIAVDSLGRAYVTGTVDLNITGITSFPTTPNSYQPVHNSGSDAYISVISPDGSNLVYSSYLGGSGSETGYDIEIESNGIAYIVGNTSVGSFPLKNSPTFTSGDRNVFVSKFDINQTGNNSLIYSTRFGAGPFSQSSGRSIALDNSGNAYVTGSIGTSFGTPTFPTTSGVYTSVYNTGLDGVMSYVTKINNTIPISLGYSTLLAPGVSNGIAVDKNTNDVFIVGTTQTPTFPVTPGALQVNLAGSGPTDAFVVKLNSTGTGLIYSTFLGGPNWDYGTSVVVNGAGEAYVTGLAEFDFPTSTGAIQPNFAGGSKDFFVAHINATGTGFGCGGSTLVGGSDTDYSGSFYDFPAPQISLRDYNGINDSITISATSHSQDFPTTPTSYGPVKVNGISDQPVFFKLTCVMQAVLPEAGFTSQTISGCQGTSVNFTDTSNNNPVSWTWSFPGGSPSSSNIQHPQNIQYTSNGSYPVSLLVCNSAGCDTILDSIIVNILQPASVALGNDTIICNGSSFALQVDTGFAGYQWFLNNSLVSTGSNQLQISQSGLYSVTVTNSDGCTAVDSQSVYLTIFNINLGPDLQLCNGLADTILATGEFVDIDWYQNGVLLIDDDSILVVNQTGMYEVVVIDSLGCSARDSIMIAVNNIVANAGVDTSVCANDTVVFSAQGNGSVFQWYYNGLLLDTTMTISVVNNGSYLLAVTDSIGCTAIDSVFLTVWPLPVLTSSNDTTLCEGQSITLAAQGADQYLWSPNTYLSSSTGSSVVCTPTLDIIYFLSGTDVHGCIAQDTIVVSVDENPVADFNYSLDVRCMGIELFIENLSQNATTYDWNFGDGATSSLFNPVHYYDAVNNLTIQLIAVNGLCRDTFQVDSLNFITPVFDSIPNVITPNNDGINDCFRIDIPTGMADCYKLIIWNRWGSEIYKSANISECWEGKSIHNVAVPEGIYIYFLELGSMNKKGFVHVYR